MEEGQKMEDLRQLPESLLYGDLICVWSFQTLIIPSPHWYALNTSGRRTDKGLVDCQFIGGEESFSVVGRISAGFQRKKTNQTKEEPVSRK